MSDLPSATLVKDCGNLAYYDYIGRVEVREPEKRSYKIEDEVILLKEGIRHIFENYIVIVDRKTGETVCEIDGSCRREFLPYEGKVISFRGRLNKHFGLVRPHNKPIF